MLTFVCKNSTDYPLTLANVTSAESSFTFHQQLKNYLVSTFRSHFSDMSWTLANVLEWT